MNLLKVSVIIPTYKSWDNLKNCLNAVSNQTLSKDYYEVIIVNNDPVNQCPFELPASNMKIIEEANPGSYAARNKGVINAKASILAFIDDDCLANKDWLRNAIKYFQNSKKAVRLAGNVKMFDRKKKFSPSSIYDQIFSFEQVQLALKGTSVTANMFAKSVFFKKVGLFDETLKSGGDTEWGLRAKVEGYDIVFAEDVVVYHPARTRLYEIIIKSKRVYGGHFYINGWHDNNLLKNFLLCLYPLRPPLRAIQKIYQAKAFSISQKLKAFGVLCTVRLSHFVEHINLSLGKTAKRK